MQSRQRHFSATSASHFRRQYNFFFDSYGVRRFDFFFSSSKRSYTSITRSPWAYWETSPGTFSSPKVRQLVGASKDRREAIFSLISVNLTDTFFTAILAIAFRSAFSLRSRLSRYGTGLKRRIPFISVLLNEYGSLKQNG